VRESDEATLERIHCNECPRKTRHRLLHKVVLDDSEFIEEVGTLGSITIFETLQCCGCEEVLLRRTWDSCEGDPEPSVRYFPPKVSRRPPSWQLEIPFELSSVLREIYRSLDANNRRLPMMGARALIDTLINDKVGDVGTFDEKLKELERLGFISPHNRKVLAAALDVGHAVTHRGHTPSVEKVNDVMDIVENLLHAVYVLPSVAEELEKSTPKRQPRKTLPLLKARNS
jgi:hypothetical protein